LIYSKMLIRIGQRIARKQFKRLLDAEKKRIDSTGERVSVNLFDSGLWLNVTEAEKRLIEVLKGKQREKEERGKKKK